MGEAEVSGHQEVLQHALDLGLSIGLVGPRFSVAWHNLRSQYPEAQILCQVNTSDVVLNSLKFEDPTDTTLLLKGSRGMKMEQISHDLQEQHQ